MKIQRAWKYKLILDDSQARTLFLWMSHLRGLYNLALEQRILLYHQNRKSLSWQDQANELPELKEVATWLKDVPSQCLQQKLQDLDKAYDKFFSGGGFPRFKKRGASMSMRFPDPKQFSVDLVRGKRKAFLKLPKIGLLKFVNSQEIIGAIKNATISMSPAGDFFVSIQTEYELTVVANSGPGIGIDRGVTNFAVTSECKVFGLPTERIKFLEGQLKQAQKLLSKKVKGSKNFQKQKLKVAKAHQNIVNLRKDSMHKISNDIANNHGLVVLEDLRTKNMTRSASGTREEPGRQVAQKSGLNRAILRNGWGEFGRQLEYKTAWNGGKVIKVAAHFTSQTCFKCHHVHKDNRNGESFVCRSCGQKDHADVNAAKNILAFGQRVLVCGETLSRGDGKTASRRRSMKQKPLVA